MKRISILLTILFVSVFNLCAITEDNYTFVQTIKEVFPPISIIIVLVLAVIVFTLMYYLIIIKKNK